MSSDMSAFALTVMQQKYSHTKPDGTKETWEEIAHRVARNVLKAVNAPKSQIDATAKIIAERKFIPGGRYLYASGRPFHQVQNCLLLRAEDSREGWSELMQKATMALMTGAGIGIDYSNVRAEGKVIRKTGGFATGPIALMQMLNEAGRGIMQGGARRSAIWAGLNWSHPDIQKFITMKNWIPEVRDLKSKDFNFPATLDGTNVSVELDDEFFEAYDCECQQFEPTRKNTDKCGKCGYGYKAHAMHAHAHSVYWSTVEQMLKTAEPGFSVDVGENSGENLRNACVPAGTDILTSDGYKPIETIAGKSVEVWNGFEWSTVTPKVTGIDAPLVRVTLSNGRSLVCTPNHEFALAIGYTGTMRKVEAQHLKKGDCLINHDYPVVDGEVDLPTAYSQGFVSAGGMDGYGYMYIYGEKISCVPYLAASYSTWEPNNRRFRTKLSFTPLPKSFVPDAQYTVQTRLAWLSGLLDGDGTELKEGGSQVASVDMGFLLNVQKMLTTLGTASKVTLARKAEVRLLPDGHGGKAEYACQTLYRLLIGAVEMQRLVSLGLNTHRLNFSDYTPQRNASQFVRVVSVKDEGKAALVYCFNEPLRHLGCFDGVVTGQCTEVTSRDDSDICNLGSVNMARTASLEEMATVVELGTAFLLAGTVYSDVPYAKVDAIRTQNRRLGLGVMGLHEWMLTRGLRYGPSEELSKYLTIYKDTSDSAAAHYADKWDLSHPVKVRAIAPTGTIGIVGETTTGIEPLFCVAYKRRYLKGSSWNYQYVIDPTAKRLIDAGVNPDAIEDAYTLAENVERRVEFQAWVQEFVDHGISSTINLPAWGSPQNNANTVQDFGRMLIKYLPKLRGITAYPDGARSGQPLNPVKYATAARHLGEIFYEQADVCDISRGGSCGA